MPQPELLPELQPYAFFGGGLFHPLVKFHFYDASKNAACNEAYLNKVACLADCCKRGDWQQFAWLYQRPYRLEAFAAVAGNLADEEYWSLLASLWTDSENLWQDAALLGRLLDADRAGREAMMNEREREFLSQLPERFAVYRGARHGTLPGLSWTLSYWQARSFARRTLAARSGVTRAVAGKRDVVAVLLGRGEFEVIVRPERLSDPRRVRGLRRPPRLQAVLDEAAETFPLGERPLHGRWHWEAVERNAIAIARETPGCDATVARLFAYLHDARRESDERDPEHGLRGARFAEELFRDGRLPIGRAQLELLSEACRFHADGRVTDDPTLGVCWDADRLDLPRMGTVPDPALLSTEAGRRLRWQL